MLGNLKALIVVLSIASITFYFARNIALSFISEESYRLRRNTWFALTIVAFLTPSFWLYVIVAAPILIWLGSKDDNPLAIYLILLCVIPPWGFEIPAIGISKLFDLNQGRLLSIFVLLPAAWSIFRQVKVDDKNSMLFMDILLVSFGLLQILIYLPHESPTNSVRRGLLFVLDIYLPFFVAKRSCASKSRIIDALATFCLACALFTPLAVFESVRKWVLYAQIGELWGYEDLEPYLLRGSILRAQASTGHALSLGYLMAMGFGFWLYLKSGLHSASRSLVVAGWMCVGMLAAYSRGPWLSAALLYFLFLALDPAGLKRFFKNLLVAFILAIFVLFSPLGERIIDNLPFVGSVDQQNVIYRQHLAEMSLMLIQRNPFFGDPFVLLQMEELRQGQGIIDLVNAYATVALFYGLVGLGLFVGFYIFGLWKATLAMIAVRRSDPHLSRMGSNLISCMLSTMFFMATAGSTALQYIIAGLLASYAKLVFNESSEISGKFQSYKNQK